MDTRGIWGHWSGLWGSIFWRRVGVSLKTQSCLFPISRSHQMYYMFGFLFLVFIILVITCSEATILLCYFHLCAEVTLWPVLKCDVFCYRDNIKGTFQCKINPWSNTPWHRVRPPPPREIKFADRLCSFSNLRNDCTITVHCSICL